MLLFKDQTIVPAQFSKYPRMRFMGNKYKLIPWINKTLESVDYQSVLDPFSGSGTVSYYLKTLGKDVTSSDFLNFPNVITCALVENDNVIISNKSINKLITNNGELNFAYLTYKDIFYTYDDLKFIDSFWGNLNYITNRFEKSIAITALIRACAKRQPRGTFTVSDPTKYNDGRRDLTISIKEHFIEQCHEVNNAIFKAAGKCESIRKDVFNHKQYYDLVYLDPPYIPKENDNCYMKRYHFLEGVSCYWKGQDIMESSKVKKIAKPFTPFSYKKTAVQTFDKLFSHFSKSKIALSYSSNSIPSIEILESLMLKYKDKVTIHSKEYRYNFGNHTKAKINNAEEFLLIGE